MNTGALGIRTVIDGVEYGDEAVRRWELDRSRAALTLLKQRIGDERMRELLALDLAESDATMAPLPNGASGAWRSAVTEMTVAGIDVDRFLTWWQGRLAGGDRSALLSANPEHYLADSSGEVVEIIETIGSGPPVLPHLPRRRRNRGRGPRGVPRTHRRHRRLGDGTEIARVMHEFGDGPDGLRIRLTIQFPANTPEHVFVGHQWHFACEFTNWLEGAHAQA